MNTQSHTINELFHQLGLPSEDQEIEDFVQSHKIKGASMKLYQAPFWNPSQSVFIKESWQDDSEWCYQIDNLDAWLRT